jgi:hypothetical protein
MGVESILTVCSGITQKGSDAVKRVRCCLGWHRWRAFHTDDGDRYAKCAECGKVRDLDHWPPLAGSWGISPPQGF